MSKTYIKQLLEDRLSYVEGEIKYYNYLLKSYLEGEVDDLAVEEYDYSDEIKTTKDTLREYEDEKILIENTLKELF